MRFPVLRLRSLCFENPRRLRFHVLLLATLSNAACQQTQSAAPTHANDSASAKTSDNRSFYNERGRAALEAGQFAEAQRNFEQSLAIGEELSKQNPGSVRIARELAYSHGMLGATAAGAGELAVAKRRYEQGLAVVEGLTRAYPASSDEAFLADPAYLELEQMYVALGTVAVMANEPAEAKRRFEQGLAIDDKLMSLTSTPELVERVGYLLEQLGLLALADRQWADARRRYQRALAIEEILMEQNPSSSEREFRAAEYHYALGFVLGDAEHKRRAAAMLAHLGNGETLPPPMRPRFNQLKQGAAEKSGE
jgi:tetratricopeptide (TPR) repeat protein